MQDNWKNFSYELNVANSGKRTSGCSPVLHYKTMFCFYFELRFLECAKIAERWYHRMAMILSANSFVHISFIDMVTLVDFYFMWNSFLWFG